MERRICPDCGMDYDETEIKDHIAFHNNNIIRKFEDQAQIELSEMDRITRYKADQYDKIADMFFMSCGCINDGDSLRYIIDPETVAEELMKIIVQDISIDRDDFSLRKVNHFKEGSSVW